MLILGIVWFLLALFAWALLAGAAVLEERHRQECEFHREKEAP